MEPLRRSETSRVLLVFGAIAIAGLLGTVVTADAKPRLGTRANPYPMGRAVRLSDGWVVTVLSVSPNANAPVRAANQFNDPPKAGRVFFMVKLRATYRGSKESDNLNGGFRFRLVGRSNLSYTTFGDQCGVIPAGIDEASSDVFKGGTISGNVCWQVRRTDVASLVMYDDGFFGSKVFFKVRR